MDTLIRIAQITLPITMLMATGCNWPQGGGLSSWAPQRVPPPGTNSYSNADYYRGPAMTSTPTAPAGNLAAEPAPYGVQPANYQNWGPPVPAASPAQSVRSAIESNPTPTRMQLKGMPAVDLTASYAPDGTPLPAGSSVPATTYPNSSLVAAAPFGPNMVRGQLNENPPPPSTRLPQSNFRPIEGASTQAAPSSPAFFTASTNVVKPTPQSNSASVNNPPNTSNGSSAPLPTGPTDLKELPWQRPR